MHHGEGEVGCDRGVYGIPASLHDPDSRFARIKRPRSHDAVFGTQRLDLCRPRPRRRKLDARGGRGARRGAAAAGHREARAGQEAEPRAMCSISIHGTFARSCTPPPPFPPPFGGVCPLQIDGSCAPTLGAVVRAPQTPPPPTPSDHDSVCPYPGSSLQVDHPSLHAIPWLLDQKGGWMSYPCKADLVSRVKVRPEGR